MAQHIQTMTSNLNEEMQENSKVFFNNFDQPGLLTSLSFDTTLFPTLTFADFSSCEG